ncbi:hypothetical protein KQI63_00395 [bacterium]|nr:hypothetical protein [bacterium]
MNDMGKLGVVWQILLGIVLAIGGILILGSSIGWIGTVGAFLLVFGLIVINGTKLPKKQQQGKKRR